jgi:hypothetical protein
MITASWSDLVPAMTARTIEPSPIAEQLATRLARLQLPAFEAGMPRVHRCPHGPTPRSCRRTDGATLNQRLRTSSFTKIENAGG